VLVAAAVNRIRLEKTRNGNFNTVGVQFEYASQTYVANARKEVILSAGALKSSHILELSGIGRKGLLLR